MIKNILILCALKKKEKTEKIKEKREKRNRIGKREPANDKKKELMKKLTTEIVSDKENR